MTPMTAKEIIPAAGTVAADGPKCFRAKTYASVGLLLNVSITSVRLELSFADVVVSVWSDDLDIRNASPPPKMGSKQDPIILPVSIPKEKEEVAAPPATNISVDRTPNMGQNGLIRLSTNRGAYLPATRPHRSGNRMRFATD